MSKWVQALPPTYTIEDRNVRAFCDALANAWELRNGNIGADDSKRFITKEEFDGMAAESMLKMFGDAANAVTNPGGGDGGPNSQIIDIITQIIASSALYDLLGQQISLIKPPALLATSVMAEVEALVASLVNEVDATLRGLIDEVRTLAEGNAAAIIEINEVSSDSESALARQVVANIARIDQSEALIINETLARATADEAQARSITLLSATVEDNSAMITAINDVRVDSDSASARQIFLNKSSVENAEALILTEQETRAAADFANAHRFDALMATVNNNTSAIASINEVTATSDSTNARSLFTVYSRFGTRPNLLKNGDFSFGKDYWAGTQLGAFNVVDDSWGRSLTTTNPGSASGSISHEGFPAVPGEKYVIHGDATFAATSGALYFDLLFYNSSWAPLAYTAPAGLPPSFTFDNADGNRSKLAFEVTAPANTAYCVARFVWANLVGVTRLGCRLIKVEAGGLPYTTFNSQAAFINEVNTRATAYDAMASQVTQLSAEYNGVVSAISNEQTVRSTSDTAFVSAVNTMWGVVGNANALVQDGTTISVNPNVGQATNWNQVQAAVRDPNTGQTSSSAILQETRAYASNVDGKMNASYVVRASIASGGQTVVGGFGLMATSGAGSSAGPTINFGVRADQFFIAAPSGQNDTTAAGDIFNGAASNGIPFVVLTNSTYYGGRWLPAGVYMKKAIIADASIDTAKIAQNIRSDNFPSNAIDGNGNIIVPNATAGWAIDKTGQAVFSNVKVRGDVEATTIKADRVDIVKTLMLDKNAVTITNAQVGSGGGSGYGSSSGSAYPQIYVPQEAYHNGEWQKILVNITLLQQHIGNNPAIGLGIIYAVRPNGSSFEFLRFNQYSAIHYLPPQGDYGVTEYALTTTSAAYVLVPDSVGWWSVYIYWECDPRYVSMPWNLITMTLTKR